MPIFETQREAQEAHEHYHIDTDREGKFSHRHTGWLRTKQILDWIPDGEPIVLGIGCNTGGLESAIRRLKKGSVVFGIDINSNLTKLACAKGILARTGKAEELPHKDGFFDVVVLSEILEHLYEPEVALREVLRVLRNRGMVVGSVPHSKSENAKKGIENHSYHTRIFTSKSLGQLLKPLKSLKIKEVYHHPDFYKKPQWFCFRGFKIDS